jgi:hypothetical protein
MKVTVATRYRINPYTLCAAPLLLRIYPRWKHQDQGRYRTQCARQVDDGRSRRRITLRQCSFVSP